MFKRCCSLGVLSLVFLLGITSVSFAGSGNISLEDGVMVVRGYSKSSPGKLSDILAAAEREGWDVITYTSENDTYNLSTLLQIGDEKIETYFQIGTGGHEKEILIIEGEIRIKGKASLTIGVKEDKSFSPTVKLDAPKLKDQELLAKGTNATFNCYNSTIVGFHRIAYRQGAKGEFIDSQFDKEVEIDCGASSVELQGAKVEGIKLSTRTEDCVRVKNCEMNGKLPLYVEYGANVIVYDSKIKSGTIVSRNKSHLILEGCQLDSLSFQVEKNSTILIKPYCLVRVLDTNGNALSGIKVRMECKESGDKEELVTNARGECLFKAASKMIDNLGFQKVNEYSYRISLDGKVVRDGWSPEKNITLEYRKKNGNYMEKGLPYEGNKNIICNLLEYGDFEICTNKPTDKYPGIPDGWAHLNLAGHHIHFPDLWFGVDETTAYHGRKSLKIKFPGTYLCDTAGYDYHRITGYPPLIVPGETYTASIYLKSDREGFPLTFVFGPARKKLTVGTSWKRYIVTATMPDSYPRMVYDLMRIHIYPGKDKRIIGGTLWLDAVQVEQGEIVHSYQPSLHESIVKKVVMPLKDINRRKIPVLAAIKTKSPPQIDGYLDDTCWKESAYVEDFILVDGSGYPAEQTKGYITYDDNYLYIGIECFDLHMDKLKTEEKQHDGNVWTDDCVEVFLDTNHDHLTYYHFIANALGTQYEEKNPERIGWNGAWEVKTTRNNKSWIAEIAIALKELELLPGHEKTWGINLCREQKYKKENSSLSCTFSSFHTPSRFADLKGIDIAASADGYKITELTYDYLTIEKKLCLHLKLKNDTEQVRKLKIHGKLISPSGKRDSIKRKLNLSGNKEIVLAFPIDEYGNYKLNVEVADKRARYSSPEILCQIPDLLTISTRDYYTTEKECKIKVVLGIKRKEELKGLTLNASLLEEDGRKVLKEKQLNLT
ncbi:carbohydrate binding family 9 domain-containing protein, partial [candidate division WOR-3 bacterium]|nr:carbohydrate binding family 9 domain-containing protein [candidate division WOR-3 bacterium]